MKTPLYPSLLLPCIYTVCVYKCSMKSQKTTAINVMFENFNDRSEDTKRSRSSALLTRGGRRFRIMASVSLTYERRCFAGQRRVT